MESTRPKGTLMLVIATLVTAMGPGQSDAEGVWVAIDLGTLDGGETQAAAINNLGQVVGVSRASVSAFLWEDGFMVDIGTPAGLLASGANDINDAGQIVGDGAFSDGFTRGVLWDNGVPTDLRVQGDVWSNAIDINEVGQVIGVRNVGGSQIRGYIWEQGILTDLGSLGGSQTHPLAINDSGQVVGLTTTANESLHVFLWESGVMLDLGATGGVPANRFFSINNLGQVAFDAPDQNGGTRGMLWDSGVVTDIGTLCGPSAYPADINDQGQIVGFSCDTWFLWDNGQMTDIGSAMGVAASGDLGSVHVNDQGQVVATGILADGSRHPFLWESGITTDLGALDSGCFGKANDINNVGEIIGWSESDCTAGSGHRATLWRKINPLSEIEEVIAMIEALVEFEQLNSGPGNAAINNLNLASAMLNDGKENVALNKLSAVINTFEGLMPNTLSSVLGDPIVQRLDLIVFAIGDS